MILNDKQIKKLVEEQDMISPFVDKSISKGISHGINSFGYDVSLRLVGGNADWPSLCALDSDEDGFTNAEELGDPDCTWREGDPAPNVSPTAPGDPGSFPQPVLPDMMMEDMAPPVDLAPPPDAAPPVDMLIDVYVICGSLLVEFLTFALHLLLVARGDRQRQTTNSKE